MFKYCFRVDDIYLDGRQIENQLFELFKHFNVPLNIGVIPFDKDCNLISRKENFKKFRDILEVSLHGYQHKNISNTKKCSEFKGEDISVQMEKISKGKLALDSELNVTISTFIPPWNSYDENTLKACEYLNIQRVSVGYSSEFDNNLILEIPVSVEHFTFRKGFIFNLYQKLASSLYSGVIVVLFHPYNFTNNYFQNEKKRFEINFDELELFLKKLTDNDTRFLKFSDINKKSNFCHKLYTKVHRKLYKEHLKIIEI
jgi:hypothetical protein